MVALVAAVGCAKEKEVEGICIWVIDPGDCTTSTTGDAGAGETGETGETGKEEAPSPCITAPNGQPRTVYQCAGEFSATIDFETVKGSCVETLEDHADLCQEEHAFGPNEEPYEMPAVMACCDVTDPIDEDHYKLFCGADLFEQICASIPKRLQKYIDDGAFPIGANQAQKLQNYLAEHQQDCYDELYHPNENTPGVFGNAKWLVNDGNNDKWKLLSNFTITVDSATITSVALPDDMSEYQACYDSTFNNTEVFEETAPTSPGINSILYLANAGRASMAGPVVNGGPVTGEGELASRANPCVEPWCSWLEVTVDAQAGSWTLENLEFYAYGLASFTNGFAALDIERGAIRLYHVAQGNIEVDEHGALSYTVAAGEAAFLVSGVSAFALDLKWATNTTPIVMRETSTGWVIDRFEVEHVDREGQRWTVAVPATSWE